MKKRRHSTRIRAISGLAFGLLVVIGAHGLRADEPGRSSPAPAKPSGNSLAAYDALIRPADRDHWAFKPPTRPPLPSVRDPSRVRNPIDLFVLARLEEKGWKPAPPATPEALVRRLYLDLVGLPPKPEERAAFLNDCSGRPDAFERLADSLLASPAFGERWARHWLDLVRFAESNGYERDAAKPFAWRYRDYVIRAFNDDKPFDRFLREQLAGDELADDQRSAETLIATGFLRLGPWDDEPADPRQDRFDQLDDMVVTTSEVFLGLTLGCARCHNHKFEPLSAHDYYRMVAVFDPLRRPQNGRMELTLPIGSPRELAARDTKGLPQGYFLHETSGAPPDTRLLLRGQATNPGPSVAPGVPAVLVKGQPSFERAGGTPTTGRRLTLAGWLTDRHNPLTARVIVNRVWQGHFGAGLVRTPSDFGTMGDPPSHPELLDWLATGLIEHGWSLKWLHRLILSSSTYRMSSRNDPALEAEDPEDRLLWRMPYRRLEVEAIRDSILAASGRLDRRMYGPSVYPPVPAGALEGHSDPATVWRPSDEASASRRTVYVFIKRALVVPMLEVLDFCDTARSASRRNVTSVPTQALTLLNGDFVNAQSRYLAERLAREAGPDPSDRIGRAFLLTLGRRPRPAELATLTRFLGEGDRLEASLVQACRAIFNTNEFVYPD